MSLRRRTPLPIRVLGSSQSLATCTMCCGRLGSYRRQRHAMQQSKTNRQQSSHRRRIRIQVAPCNGRWLGNQLGEDNALAHVDVCVVLVVLTGWWGNNGATALPRHTSTPYVPPYVPPARPHRPTKQARTNPACLPTYRPTCSATCHGVEASAASSSGVCIASHRNTWRKGRNTHW